MLTTAGSSNLPKLLCVTLVLLSGPVCGSPADQSGGPQLDSGTDISLRSLLRAMLDRDRLARFPAGDRAYASRQASSYERESVRPDAPGWYANHDWSHFIRVEERAGRREWVMMDADGPGCITRMWMGGVVPYGKLRFYIDTAEKPVIEAQVEDLLGGEALVGPPFSEICARGRNLYLPIPYAKHCKVTYDGPNYWEGRERGSRTWYVIGYHTYLQGNVEVKSFSMEDYRKAAAVVAEVGKALLAPGEHLGDITDRRMKRRRIPPDESEAVVLKGAMAVRELRIRLLSDTMDAALAETLLRIEFDGRTTVEVPVGHFFGSGVGYHPYKGWFRHVRGSGEMSCYWVMPYQRQMRVSLTNQGEAPVEVVLDVATGPWRWDEDSMYFHARMRREAFAVTAQQGRDWNFVTISGRGVFVGDTLSIHNGAKAWWGEGDEKIWVDGEAFPSMFGTGTEDYYGYSYGSPLFFEAPFHAQPTGAGNAAPADSTNTRTRSLDAIPFTRSLKFDMEAWHWASCAMVYAATTYWYQVP